MSPTHSIPNMGESSMFTQPHSRLPTNEELPFLPPLPDTPQHAYKSYLSEEYLLKAKTPLTRKLWEERVNSPMNNHNGDVSPKEGNYGTIGLGSGMKRSESSRKWDVEIDYPVLSTRQNVFHTPGTAAAINRVPSIDLLKTVRTPSQSKYQEKEESPSPDDAPKNVVIALPTITQSDNMTIHKQEEGVLELENTKLPDTQHLSPIKASEPIQPRLSASFNLPTYVADASLLANQSLMGGASSSAGDEDSFHLDIDKLRPKRASSEEKDDHIESISNRSSLSNTPTKPSHSKPTFLAPPQNALDQSTLLPRSPAKIVHLLEPKHALNNVEPPWAGDDSLLYDSSVSSRENSLSPEKTESSSSIASSSIPHSQTIKGFPTSSSSHSIVSLPKIRRTFPASSSGQSLSSVVEDGEYGYNHDNGEISTLLPVSPLKSAHLLTDAELITKETLLEEGSSFRLPLPARATPYKPSFMVKTPKKSPPARMSPIRTIVRGNIHKHSEKGLDESDLTFDVKDLLAKVGKPKRASGTEESFVDLLHDDFMPDGLDASMIGPDESMLPPSLRPRGIIGKIESPIKGNSYASPARFARPFTGNPTEITTTIKRLPISHTTHNLAAQADEKDEEAKQATITRSKSLSRVAEIIERVRSARTAAQNTQTIKSQVEIQAEKEDEEEEEEEEEEVLIASPPKTAVRTQTNSTSRTAAAATSGVRAKPRTSIMPPPPTSRRISLSAGAIPLTSNASHKAVNLPSSRFVPTKVTNNVTSQPASTASRRLTTTARSGLGATAAPSSSSRLAGTSATTSSRPSASTRTSRLSMAPPASRVEVRSRTSSTSSTVSSSAALPSSRTATASSRLTARPSIATAPGPRATVASTRPTSTITSAPSRLSRPSTITRSVGLPKPGEGPTARSATIPSAVPSESRTKLSRGFGTDASAATNRVPRSSLAPTSRIVSKLSTGPASSRTTGMDTAKSRALSTPASSTLTKASVTDRVPPVPALPVSRLTRPSTLPTTSKEGIKKTSMPPPVSTATATSQRTRVGSIVSTQGLPRPTVRSTATIGIKTSAPPTSGATAGPGLAALRERLDRLHAKQVR
ncbi:uncharacterized protein L201_000282 [Kwoniella dendrophila CBS 6074]|uniref:Uncharacterized protein n=1 Tax=Kwoniella dendrophila CBS 6074 TaxID=1295534 RepID=A0AAX4JKY7_9TREE